MTSPNLETFDYRLEPVKCTVKVETVRRGLTAPHKVARITPPAGYLKPDPVVLTPGRSRRMVLIDPKKARIHGGDVASIYRTAAKHLGLGWALGAQLAKRPDRVYLRAKAWPHGGHEEWFERSGAWTRDPNRGKGHEPHEPGYELAGSWRSKTTPSVQAVLWRKHDAGKQAHALELDIDYHRPGIKHIVGEVIYNKITGAKTEPIVAAQLCAWAWPMKLPFQIEPGS